MESSLFHFQADLFGPLKTSLKWVWGVERGAQDTLAIVLHMRFKVAFARPKNAII